MRSILVSTTRGLNYTEVGAFCSAFMEIIEKLCRIFIKTQHRNGLELITDKLKFYIILNISKTNSGQTSSSLINFYTYFTFNLLFFLYLDGSTTGIVNVVSTKTTKVRSRSIFSILFPLIIPTNRLPKGRFAFREVEKPEDPGKNPQSSGK